MNEKLKTLLVKYQQEHHDLLIKIEAKRKTDSFGALLDCMELNPLKRHIELLKTLIDN